VAFFDVSGLNLSPVQVSENNKLKCYYTIFTEKWDTLMGVPLFSENVIKKAGSSSQIKK
jgi:hypothetical protein